MTNEWTKRPARCATGEDVTKIASAHALRQTGRVDVSPTRHGDSICARQCVQFVPWLHEHFNGTSSYARRGETTEDRGGGVTTIWKGERVEDVTRTRPRKLVRHRSWGCLTSTSRGQCPRMLLRKVVSWLHVHLNTTASSNITM